MPVTELYTFNLTCVILLVALYGVALNSNKQAAVLWYGSLLLFSELIQIRNAEESLYVALLYW